MVKGYGRLASLAEGLELAVVWRGPGVCCRVLLQWLQRPACLPACPLNDCRMLYF